MRGGAGARRRRARAYVQAMIVAAERDTAWEAWESDVRVVRALAADDRVRAFLTDARLPRAERLGVVDRLREDRLGSRGRGLLRVLIERRDLVLAADIERAFLRRADELRRLDRVQVTSAVPLTDTQTRELEKRLARSGRLLRLTTTTDPGILGGVVIRQGDHLMDFSVRAKLQALAGALR